MIYRKVVITTAPQDSDGGSTVDESFSDVSIERQGNGRLIVARTDGSIRRLFEQGTYLAVATYTAEELA